VLDVNESEGAYLEGNELVVFVNWRDIQNVRVRAVCTLDLQ
jgi:hypothetical protein